MESDMYIPNYKMDAEIIPNVEKRRRRWIRIICILSFVFMLLISFTSHLVNHIEVQNLKRELKTTKDKANDLIHAKQLDLEMQRKHRHSHKVDGLSEITSRLGAGKRRRRHNSGATPAFSFKGSDGQQATPVYGQQQFWQAHRVRRRTAYLTLGLELWAFHPYNNQSTQLDSAYGVQVSRGAEYGYGYDDFPTDSIEVSGLYFIEQNDELFVKKVIFTKIRILQTGQYYMEAKIAIEGRDREEYSGYLRVGLELRKTLGGTSQVLDKTYLTQDHSNFPNQPLDTISVAGLFCLKLNDVIFVAISENIPFSPIFKTGPEHARFDAYMVNSENDYCP
ncbi:hypothetical protein MAR_013234 [Mya arenaria]|uniref:TNF family profile domain-containing protein n=1 Tax=Mya arenaria TaxID=6604 RepID=A0ABY7FZF1_MYAAR|nr:hypothetical protein MAR_013234 [Mya arenaria]